MTKLCVCVLEDLTLWERDSYRIPRKPIAEGRWLVGTVPAAQA